MGAIKIIEGVWQVGGGSWGKVAKAVSVEGCGNMYLVGGPTGEPEKENSPPRERGVGHDAFPERTVNQPPPSGGGYSDSASRGSSNSPPRERGVGHDAFPERTVNQPPPSGRGYSDSASRGSSNSPPRAQREENSPPRKRGVGAESEFAIIDAGIPAGVKAVLANAAEAGAGPGQIKRIVLTHAHSDHVAGAEDLRRATGAVLAAHPLTARALAGEPDAARQLFVGEMRATVAETIADGDEVALGPYRFRAIHTPGHMPDCVCLFGQVGGRRVLISGDEAIGDQGEDLGIVGWLDMHWGSAPKRYVASLEKLAALRADLVLPGHGKPIDGERAVADSFAHCLARLRQLLAIPHLHTMMGLDMSE